MLDTIRKKRSTPILISLLEAPKHVRELRSDVGGSASTVASRVQELSEIGLIQEELADEWPRKKILKLTDRGEDVAKVLKDLSGSARKRKIALMSFEERMKWPLMVLHKLGEVGGATRMQKLLFLLKNRFDVGVPYDFTPYKHGPFSKSIGRDMANLVTAGLVDHLEDAYVLTQEGKEMAREMYEDLQEGESKAIASLERYNKMRLQRLLDYVYTKYPRESGTKRETSELEAVD